jgi:hypothetical protein
LALVRTLIADGAERHRDARVSEVVPAARVSIDNGESAYVVRQESRHFDSARQRARRDDHDRADEVVLGESMASLFLGDPNGVRLSGGANTPTTYWGRTAQSSWRRC